MNCRVWRLGCSVGYRHMWGVNSFRRSDWRRGIVTTSEHRLAAWPIREQSELYRGSASCKIGCQKPDSPWPIQIRLGRLQSKLTLKHTWATDGLAEDLVAASIRIGRLISDAIDINGPFWNKWIGKWVKETQTMASGGSWSAVKSRVYFRTFITSFLKLHDPCIGIDKNPHGGWTE